MGQKSRWTLPATVYPDGYRRFVICVPDEEFYIAAFEGLLIELTYSKNWQRDNAHTAALVTRLWQQVLASASCEQECTTLIEEMDYEMSICEQLRFHNGHLQGFCCGEWVDITGQSPQGTDGPSQPGDGSEQPTSGGGCKTYSGKFDATGQWLVPTVVSAGDTVSFANFRGATTDGTLRWYCPDGQVFFAGLCAGGTAFNGADPAPALHHMTAIAKIGAAYYDATAGVITVPGGISNAQIILQVNDSTRSDNGGDLSFDVTVCNNQAGLFTHIFDFALSDGGFTIDPNGGDPGGVYTLGSGWQPTIETGPSHWFEVYIKRTFASRTITGITAYYDSAWTTNSEPGGFSMYGTPGVGTLFGSKAPDQGTTVVWPIVGSMTCTELKVDFNQGKTVSGHLSGQSFTLKKLVVTGVGTDPF